MLLSASVSAAAATAAAADLRARDTAGGSCTAHAKGGHNGGHGVMGIEWIGKPQRLLAMATFSTVARCVVMRAMRRTSTPACLLPSSGWHTPPGAQMQWAWHSVQSLLSRPQQGFHSTTHSPSDTIKPETKGLSAFMPVRPSPGTRTALLLFSSCNMQ
jgi:hypothetical protein